MCLRVGNKIEKEEESEGRGKRIRAATRRGGGDGERGGEGVSEGGEWRGREGRVVRGTVGTQNNSKGTVREIVGAKNTCMHTNNTHIHTNRHRDSQRHRES